MPKVQETKTLTIDGVTFAVDKMSPQLQQLVVMMDDWRQREADLMSENTMVKAALRGVQNDIYAIVTKERQAAMEKAQQESANDEASEPAGDFVEQEQPSEKE